MSWPLICNTASRQPLILKLRLRPKKTGPGGKFGRRVRVRIWHRFSPPRSVRPLKPWPQQPRSFKLPQKSGPWGVVIWAAESESGTNF